MKIMIWLACAGAILAGGCAGGRQAVTQNNDRIPVILDTDIGNDIDDTWALMMLLRSPRLDVKLITTTDGQPEYRGRLIAKLLTIAGRTDIPIGLGPDAGKKTGEEKEAKWLGTYQLDQYPGAVKRDGVAALIETIRKSDRPVTVIAIGPLQTLAAALERDPGIAPEANFVGMQGSVFKGYGGSQKPDPEFNVKMAIPAAQKVFSAPWKSAAITPLDTCGLPGVAISGVQYQALRASEDPVIKAILDSYAAWHNNADPSSLNASTVLYDTVAIYLADPQNRSLLQIQMHPITVTDDGRTIVAAKAREMAVATGWNDLEAYRDYLVTILQNASGR